VAQLNRIVLFDWRRDTVRRDSIEVRLSRQEKILLRQIVENSGRTCGRDELMAVIWGTRARHIDELYLTQLIYRLRKSLRPLDLARRVVTVARAGYRFDAAELECRIDDCANGSLPIAPRESTASVHRWRADLSRELFRWPRRSPARDGEIKAALCLPTSGPQRYEVSHAGVTVYLTRLEHTLLAVLTGRPDVTIERAELIARVWGAGVEVDTHRLTRLASRLRRSLQPLGLDSRVIHVPGEGYRFCCEPIAQATQGNARPRWRELCRRVLPGTARGSVLLIAALSVCGTAPPTSERSSAVSAVSTRDTAAHWSLSCLLVRDGEFDQRIDSAGANPCAGLIVGRVQRDIDIAPPFPSRIL
jgi:DNA-binding winged helix-turn-helix (wHTH) protein